jgi:glycosyltransferase involved in cell wall biosynthesis
MLDVFVLPSQAEGTSCTLQEAMASGLPVVATAVGGTPELVEEGVTGHLVPSDDEAALASAIHRVFSEEASAGRFALTARSRATNQFGLDAMVRAYQSVFASPQRAAQWQAAH